jgi:RNA polymerase-binding transcription factor DksA
VPTRHVLAGNFAGVTEPDRDSPETESISSQPQPSATAAPPTEVDLDAIEQDLTGVEVALSRLAEGTYWTDEVTGSPIPDHVLDADPTARRA